MRRLDFILLAIGLSVSAVVAQQPTEAMVVFDSAGENLRDLVVDDRLGDRPLAQADKTLRIDRELRQGEAVVSTRPPPKKTASSLRVRARATVQEDRERVKRDVAISQAAP